jgi:hypothetical protein
MLTLFLGFAHKSVCVGEAFDDRAFRYLCYSDLGELYPSERFAGGVPYLDAPSEYPVVTGFLMWSASLIGHSQGTFYLANVVVLAALGLITSAILYRMVGARALYLALAPTLAFYAFLNWDLLVVALAAAATLAFLRRRDAAAGVLLGVGVASKLYPVLLLIPFALARRREGDRGGAIRIGLGALVAWLVLDLPFMLLAFDRWSEVFRYSSDRIVHWATLWFVGCHAMTGRLLCEHVDLVNRLSVLAFAGAAVLVWRAKVAREPDVPRWTLAFPLIIVFLLSSKVYSPQYSLWLVPWFALVLPELRLFVAFEAVDLATFVSEFAWLGGAPTWLLEFAVLMRATVLVIILVAFVRRPTASLAAPAAGPDPIPSR